MSYKVNDTRASQQPADFGEVSRALETSREAREDIAQFFGVPVELLEPVRTTYEESRAKNARDWNELMLIGYPVETVKDDDLDHGDVFMRAPKRTDFDRFKNEYLNTPMLAEEDDDGDDQRQRADERARRRWERSEAEAEARRPRRID